MGTRNAELSPLTANPGLGTRQYRFLACYPAGAGYGQMYAGGEEQNGLFYLLGVLPGCGDYKINTPDHKLRILQGLRHLRPGVPG